jgi:Fe-S-cluster containining protein
MQHARFVPGEGIPSPTPNSPVVRPKKKAVFITDLDTIAALADEQERENRRFRTFLKQGGGGPQEEFDALVARTYKEVCAAIDCCACANCCRVLQITIVKDEMQRMAEAFDVDVDEFEEEHLKDGGDKDRVLREMPCPLLDGNLCSIYRRRPGSCRDYPNLTDPYYLGKQFLILDHVSVCPLVFNAMQLLKERTGFDLSKTAH